MNDLALHEQFEIAVLERLSNRRLLGAVVFGGGTMLRLCYGLSRYSVDLDFWLRRPEAAEQLVLTWTEELGRVYELTDTAEKRNTLLFELRSSEYPRRLKLEVRKTADAGEARLCVAFSPFSTKQVRLRAHTLEETMRRKVRAALNRKLIRDFFDLEFLVQRGVALAASPAEAHRLLGICQGFARRDYRVTLGSLLSAADRSVVEAQEFGLLRAQLQALAAR